MRGHYKQQAYIQYHKIRYDLFTPWSVLRLLVGCITMWKTMKTTKACLFVGFCMLSYHFEQLVFVNRLSTHCDIMQIENTGGNNFVMMCLEHVQDTSWQYLYTIECCLQKCSCNEATNEGILVLQLENITLLQLRLLCFVSLTPDSKLFSCHHLNISWLKLPTILC